AAGEWSGELVQCSAAGGTLVMLTRLQWVDPGDGGSPLVLESGTDITRRKADEVRLREATAAAERASAAKSDFLAMMSHDLRTPLQAIMTAAEILAPDPEAPGTPPELRNINYAAQSMARLVDDLLNLARLERTRLPLERRPTNLRELLARTLDPIAATARAKGLAFEGVVDPMAPAELLTDPVRLGQILANLVGNAVKFTAVGRVRVDVRGARPGMLRIDVADTGIGIAQERQTAVFEPFMQASGEVREHYGGVGLGLAIASDLAHSLGGRIDLESAPGEGSRFRLWLPLQPPTPAEEAPPQA
ncbi:MAG: HAMP domain-containing histidine kinase, partial [Proteobacteria bacterium]|nr:HAMP domain-containing histidine kinase [Pseudomonadota bacterium]